MIEILYHTLWESVHVFFEHREMGHEVGDAGFLYPFLGKDKQKTVDAVAEVAASIQMKVRDDAHLRERVAHEEAETIGNAATAMIGQNPARGQTDHFWQRRFRDGRQ